DREIQPVVADRRAARDRRPLPRPRSLVPVDQGFLGGFLSGRGYSSKSSAVECTASGLSTFASYAVSVVADGDHVLIEPCSTTGSSRIPDQRTIETRPAFVDRPFRSVKRN